MKILVNASTLVVGGGIQVGLSFIERALEENRFQWKFVLSRGIYDHLQAGMRDSDTVYCIDPSPAKPFAGRNSRKQIKQLCRSWQPDLVYSIGFPSYIRFRSPEIGRYTNPWEINDPPLPWHLYPGRMERLKILLGIWYRQYWAKKAQFIETQTAAAREGIHRRTGFPLDRIHIVPNSPNQIFISAGRELPKKTAVDAPVRIFCLSAPYRHKNLDLIPDVAHELKNRFGHTPLFMLTLPENGPMLGQIRQKAVALGVDAQIQNLGVLKLAECIRHYQQSYMVFLPTLLEIFSATYLEAMAMQLPIVTTDLSFAHDNCGEAALFFEARNSQAAATCIHRLITEPDLYEEMVAKGNHQLMNYPSNPVKYQRLFDWFESLIKKNHYCPTKINQKLGKKEGGS
jgi:glycosyltransferase involved in cell wall biosynthesis